MIRYVVYAENIRVGGGLTLLIKLVNLLPKNQSLYYINEDLKDKLPLENVKVVKNNISSRFFNRICMGYPNAIHIHFGNLPPLLSLSRKVIIYIHNSLLVDSFNKVHKEDTKLKIRLFFEKLFMMIFIKKEYVLFVQTKHMKVLTERKFFKNKIKMFKFSDIYQKNTMPKTYPINQKILYIGGNEKYKNCSNVIEAVSQFCDEFKLNIKLSIIGVREELYKKQINKRIENLSIFFKNRISRQEIFELIQDSNVLIFASENESFGLPLLEASNFGVDILAADADYVLETCRPNYLFNPKDPQSLKRALILYFKVNEYPNLKEDNEIKDTIDKAFN